MASIDPCASALLRWHERLPPDSGYDFDFGDLQAQRKQVGLTPTQDDWFLSVSGSHHYRQLTDYRGAALHRIMRQSVTVRPGYDQQERLVSSSTDIAPKLDAEDLADQITGFVLDRWREFWPALVA